MLDVLSRNRETDAGPAILRCAPGRGLAAVFGLLGRGCAAGSSPPRTPGRTSTWSRRSTHRRRRAWTDTGLNVKKGEEFYFQADGIGLPPEGQSRRGLRPRRAEPADDAAAAPRPEPGRPHRPGPGEGRGRRGQEDRGEGRRGTSARCSSIGQENRLALPAAGRLLFGVNENVIGGQRRRVRRQDLSSATRSSGRAFGRSRLVPALCSRLRSARHLLQELGVVRSLAWKSVLARMAQVEGDVGLDPDDRRHFQGGLHLLDGQIWRLGA